MELPPDLIELLAEFAAARVEFLWVGGPPARIDLMKGVPGGDFDEAWERRTVMVVAGVSIPVVSRMDLIRLKRASGRPQDLVDAELLSEGAEHDQVSRRLGAEEE